MVYQFWPAGENSVYHYGYEALDGDRSKVKIIDTTPDDGGHISVPGEVGRPIHTEFLPTKLLKQGRKRSLLDFDMAYGLMLCSERFKDLVEQFEPGVHQFVAVDLYWKSREYAGKRHFFVVCNRLSTINQEHSSLSILKFSDGYTYQLMIQGPNKITFNRSDCIGYHLWLDKRLLKLNACSNEFANAVLELGMTGFGTRHFEEI